MQTITEYETVVMRITDAFDRAGRVDSDVSEHIFSRRKFDDLINQKIKEGWQPFGAPFVILDQRWQQINQTMVKYEKADAPWQYAQSAPIDRIKE